MGSLAVNDNNINSVNHQVINYWFKWFFIINWSELVPDKRWLSFFDTLISRPVQKCRRRRPNVDKNTSNKI